MSAVDRAWLLMERRTNPMMVVGLVVLAKRLTREALRDVVTRRFLAHPRFRCRPVDDYLLGRWVEDPQLDLDAHLHHVALARGAGQPALEELVGELASTPLPQDRPMWSFHLVERYRGGSALVIRIHHCYADGIALVRVLLSLTDSTEGAAALLDGAAAAGHADGGGLLDAIEAVYQPVSGLVEKGLHLMLHPTEVPGVATDALRLAREFANIATLSDDPSTCLKAPLSGTKRVAWADPLPLEEVRTVARVLGCTINDVVMSTLAGCLGSYLERQGERLAGVELRAAVPVNLRPAGASPAALGNEFGLVFVALPIGRRHPLERLYAMHDVMQALRSSRQPLVAYGLLAALGSLPAPLEEPAIELFSAKASAVVSNVPGPRTALHMAGARISRLLFWVPQSGSIGVGVSILTYADQVQFGIVADRNLIAEPRTVAASFRPEFERLVKLTLLAAMPPPRAG
jgi:WS/DGAT/MGAT family acyltransferase